jgi:hypothetical protein
MTRKMVVAALCAGAFPAAACGGGEDDKLSREETAREVSDICDSAEFEGLRGRPAHDAPIIEKGLPAYREAIQEMKALEVDEDVEGDRNAVVFYARILLRYIEDAYAAAREGDAKAYHRVLKENDPIEARSREAAARLGATACNE